MRASDVENDFCHNCGIRLSGRFCSACGQKALPLNVTFHDFFHDVTHEMLHLDGRILQTVRRLLASPGFLTREYLQGHRARWVSPIRLYLTFSVMFFALSAFVPIQTAARAETDGGWGFSWRTGSPVRVTVTDDEDAEAAAKKLGFASAAELNQAVNHALWTWLPRTMFLLVPLFAWLVALAYRRVDGNYLHHLIFGLHVHAAFFAVGALATAATLLSRPLGSFLWAVIVPYMMVYVILAFRRVYGKVRLGFLRMAFVLSTYWAATIVAFFAIIAPVILPAILSGRLK
jgi:uncharacterized protein DUF3667